MFLPCNRHHGCRPTHGNSNINKSFPAKVFRFLPKLQSFAVWQAFARVKEIDAPTYTPTSGSGIRETGQLLRELPLDFAVVYRVMFLLINNLDVLDRLKDGKDEHAFFKAGIRYIHCLPDVILNRFLDSIAPPFSYPLEQSLLCTAIELGATGTAIAILQRRCLDLENVACIISGQAYTLLERSVQLCHVEITSALLAYDLTRTDTLRQVRSKSGQDCKRHRTARSWRKRQIMN